MKGVTLTDYGQRSIREAERSGDWTPLNPGTGEGIHPVYVRNHDGGTVTVATADGPCEVKYGWRREGTWPDQKISPVIEGMVVGRTELPFIFPVTIPVKDEGVYETAELLITKRTGLAPERMDLI